MKIRLNAKDALIVVDVQVDFLPGGALAVPHGDKVIPVLNRYIKLFSETGMPIFFTRDWHPLGHLSFKDNGGIWPSHCVAESPGALFSPELKVPFEHKYIVSKGIKHEFDAYSGFQDTQLLALMQERGIRRVFVGGLATEYCVKNTIEGAINLGFSTVLLLDAVQGIEQAPGDCAKVVDQLLRRGAFAMNLHDFAEIGETTF